MATVYCFNSTEIIRKAHEYAAQRDEAANRLALLAADGYGLSHDTPDYAYTLTYREEQRAAGAHEALCDLFYMACDTFETNAE